MPAPNVFQRPAPRVAPPLPAAVLFEVRRGLTLHQAGRVAEAAAIYQAVLKTHPQQFECLHYLGVAHLQQGQPGTALPLLERALALGPNDPSLQANLGLALTSLGRPEQALRHLDRALALRPGLPEALNNKGWALRALHRLEAALACLDQALAANPKLGEVHHRRALVLGALHRQEEALEAFERAHALRPTDAEVLGNEGTLLTFMGRAAEARAALARAAGLAPQALQHRLKHAVAWLPLVRAAGEDPAPGRARFESEVRALLAEVEAGPVARPEEAVGAAQPFYIAYQAQNNVEPLRAYGALCAQLMAQWEHAQARAQAAALHGVARAQDAADAAAGVSEASAASEAQSATQAGGPRPRVRVGIVSSHLFAHSVWQAIVRGWVTEIDRTRFELHLFHLGHTEDAETVLAREHAQSFVAGDLGLAGWVAAIRGARLDVLIYPELGMDALAPRLAALRLAPVQAASWGHPETTGLPAIDHYLSAELFESDAGPLAQSAPSARYSESLVRLPGLGCHVAPAAVRPAAQAEEFALETVGVAPGATLFVCGGTPFKYAPEHDDVLVRIARVLPSAQFVFFRHAQAASLSAQLLARLGDAFRAAGLDPAAHLVLAPWLERGRFFGVLSRAHVFLDTLGFSGFNTVMQAVECGLPVVTLRGEFMRGRLGSGILERMGLGDVVTTSVDDYVELALRLAQDPAARAALRTRMAAARDALYADTAPIRALEGHLWRWAGRVASASPAAAGAHAMPFPKT
jgi:predicted O-linked N-acetylglucosamine transferase (SPINDLY family)